MKLSLGLAVEPTDTLFEGVSHLLSGLADAGEYNPFRGTASLQNSEEFAARHDVETRALTRKQRENAE